MLNFFHDIIEIYIIDNIGVLLYILLEFSFKIYKELHAFVEIIGTLLWLWYDILSVDQIKSESERDILTKEWHAGPIDRYQWAFIFLFIFFLSVYFVYDEEEIIIAEHQLDSIDREGISETYNRYREIFYPDLEANIEVYKYEEMILNFLERLEERFQNF